MTVALQVLLKALINLPRTDFIMLKCVLPQDLVSFTLCISLAIFCYAIVKPCMTELSSLAISRKLLNVSVYLCDCSSFLTGCVVAKR